MRATMILVAVLAFPAWAKTKTFCGVRDGTAGNASLMEKGEEVVTLSTQGGEHDLLDQADALVKGGTQNGTRYCVDAEVDGDGQPTKIVAAKATKRGKPRR